MYSCTSDKAQSNTSELATPSSLDNFQHQYMPELLVNVWSYYVMVHVYTYVHARVRITILCKVLILTVGFLVCQNSTSFYTNMRLFINQYPKLQLILNIYKMIIYRRTTYFWEFKKFQVFTEPQNVCSQNCAID